MDKGITVLVHHEPKNAPVADLSAQQPQVGSQLAAQNKRKEKARIAARARRSQEASIIMEMANELHITQEKIRRIDKATIVKLAIDYIKAFEILCRFRSNSNGDNNNFNSDGRNSIINNDSNSMIRRRNSISISCINEISNSNSCNSSSSSGSTNENNCISKRNNNYDLINVNNNIRDTSDNITTTIQSANSMPINTSINKSIGTNINTTTTTATSCNCNEARCNKDHQQQNNHDEVPTCITPLVAQQQRQQQPLRQLTSQNYTDPIDIVPSRHSQSIPKLSTGLIFAPKTDDMDSYFLMINDNNGRPSFVLKPDNEILEEDDLTHLAPQAGDSSISLEVEPLDGIVLDTSLFNSGSPPMKKAPLVMPHHSLMTPKGLLDSCCIGKVD